MSYYRYTNSSYQRPSFFGGFQFFPPVIKTLLISNVAIYLLTNFFGLFRIQGIPVSTIINAYLPLYPIGDGFQPWQLFTYMFMHGGLMHLLLNMLALWMFGMELENTWGSKKFVLYYLLCGIGAGLSNLFVGPFFGSGGPTVGASGAIYGVLIAFGMIFPDRPIFVYFLLPVRAKYFVLFYIAIEMYAGITGSPDGIAHFAHLGGAAVGFAYLLIDQKRNPFVGLFSRMKHRVITSQRVSEYAPYDSHQVSDAKYNDVHDGEDTIDQQRIDEILDKISQHGYEKLSDQEKKILFDASKKLN